MLSTTERHIPVRIRAGGWTWKLFKETFEYFARISRRQKARRALDRLDERMLKDIGLVRYCGYLEYPSGDIGCRYDIERK
ncbi:DUF1127 domain-containing protein [Stappia sp. GBMRC 2046]|uniref:DUF1127 domain-containing protein n=1 Tax=Stappia sediminis TaxID=2692190 RepID=A0A7X3S9B6_9HYPH|nr:DUF1127 domain-containing protein [Stappia sediminis]MXN66703.1 DUF1127 domain-containing protein [Stappia sediminis]